MLSRSSSGPPGLRYLATTLGAFAAAFTVELVLLGAFRRALTPDPQGEQLYLVWIVISCAALSIAIAEAASFRLNGRLNVAALAATPLLLLFASWLLWTVALLRACQGVQTPFFRLSCN